MALFGSRFFELQAGSTPPPSLAIYENVPRDNWRDGSSPAGHSGRRPVFAVALNVQFRRAQLAGRIV